MTFQFTDKIVLEDERALLRPLERSDYDNLLHFSLTEKDLWKYSLVQPVGEEGLKNYLQVAIAAREAKQEYPFIVFDKKENKYAGSTRFYDMQFANKSLQLGYTWYGPAFQRTGLNRHCKYLLLQYAFETLDIDRVEFRADNNNAKSISAMKKIGCVAEGVLRDLSLRDDGTRRTTIVLSILKNEWHSSVKKRLREML